MGKDFDAQIPFDVELEDRDCPLGCTHDDEILFSSRDRINNLPGSFYVVKCNQCGLLRTNPRPTRDTISFYYPESYGPYHSTEVKSNNRPSFLKKNIPKIFPLNLENLPDIPVGQLLEIGCASGSFLNSMSELGWKVEGIELSRAAGLRAIELGYSVFIGSVDEAILSDDNYDLIVGWMVLEHLHDPVLVLRLLWKWMKPGGWLVLSIPNTASFEFNIFKDAWYALHLPNHLFHFSPKTINNLLRLTGWENVKIIHQRVIGNLMASTGFKLSDWGISERLTRFFLNFPKNGPMQYAFFPFGFILGLFGQTGRMIVWAQKPENGKR